MLDLRIKELIEDLGISKTQFAERIGYTPSYISLILNGKKTNPSQRFFDALHREFHVNPEWITSGIGNMYHVSKSMYSKRDSELIEKYKMLPFSEREIIDEIIDAFLTKNDR